MTPQLKTVKFTSIPNDCFFIQQNMRDGQSFFNSNPFFKESSDFAWMLLSPQTIQEMKNDSEIFVILPTQAFNIQTTVKELQQEINSSVENHIKFGTDLHVSPPDNEISKDFDPKRYYDILETRTLKGTEWLQFARKTLDHVDNYAVPQYHDYDHPDEQIHTWNMDDFKKAIMRYASRIGSGQRGEDEAKRDCLKIAHFACFLYSWYLKEESEK